MTHSGSGLGLRGRSGILSLVDECLRLPPPDERPVIMLLGPRGSGASEAHSALMEHVGPDHPFAYLNFSGTQALLPRYALALLARQLERKVPRYGRSRFPLLSLGLLASDQALNIFTLTEGRRAVQRHLDRFQQVNEARHGDYLATFLEAGMATVGIPEGASVVALAVLQDALRRGRNRLPGQVFSSRLSSGAEWFGTHPLTSNRDRWEALVELNLWRHEGDEQQQERLDRVLFSAFLEDLRRNTARSFMPRSYLLLLDNSHAPYGRRFLDLLIRARHDDTVVNRVGCDPLTVVASSNRWLSRWGPSSGGAWPWRLRGPDRASVADWDSNRPTRDSEDAWWYPLRLRDLNLDEVRVRIELQFGAHPDLAPYTRLTPFVHRVTGGLPRAVQQVLNVLRQSDAPTESGAEQEAWLRTLLDRPLRDGEVTRTLAESALDHLLHGLGQAERAMLARCAAARDLSVGTRVLGQDDSLFGEMRSRWLLTGPGSLVPTLHPWLRRLLLRRLARDPDGWNAAHEMLAEHYRSEERPVQEMYHLLALQRIDEIADRLLRRLHAVPATRWIDEFETVTAAPNRLLAEEGGPLELMAALGTGRRPGHAVDEAEVVHGMVTARWLWSDPLADPGMRLGNMIAEEFTQLSQLRRDDIVPFYNEAEQYRNWRHPQTAGGG